MKFETFFKLAEMTLKCPTKYPRLPLTPPLSHSLTLTGAQRIFCFSDKLKLKSSSLLHIVRSAPIEQAHDDIWHLFLRRLQ